MNEERRYQDDEVRQILDLAIGRDAASPPAVRAGEGLTLRELQEVGGEVGLSASRIAEAVAWFEGRGEILPRTTALGLPAAVGSVVSLPRNLTDREWERLVAELRTTFGGKGEVTSHGTMREWTHGTLHAFVEPTETGYRLRLADSRAAALGGGLVSGGFFLGFALLMLIALLSKDDPGIKLLIPVLFALAGGGVMALSAVTLPGWAREQERRMESISRFAGSLLGAPVPTDE